MPEFGESLGHGFENLIGLMTFQTQFVSECSTFLTASESEVKLPLMNNWNNIE